MGQGKHKFKRIYDVGDDKGPIYASDWKVLQLNNLDLKGFSFHALATEVYDVLIAFFAGYLRVVVSCMYSNFRAYLKLEPSPVLLAAGRC